MREMTWAELDRLEAERQAKARDLVERLAKVLSREFSYQEIRFIRENDRRRSRSLHQPQHLGRPRGGATRHRRSQRSSEGMHTAPRSPQAAHSPPSLSRCQQMRADPTVTGPGRVAGDGLPARAERSRADIGLPPGSVSALRSRF
jgi:hypothetical protein